MSGEPAGTAAESRCGYVAIIGRPNVGKSTLLNAIVGQKLSITSRKPQTTRWNLLGIRTGPGFQAIYVDTPGLQERRQNALNRHLNREAGGALASVDVILFVIEALAWTEADRHALCAAAGGQAPVLLVINKIDKIKDRSLLLPFIQDRMREPGFTEIIPVSAQRRENIEELEKTVGRLLPAGPPCFPEDQVTDRGEQFFAAELVREKLTRRLGAELPYQLSVTIEEFRPTAAVTHVHAVVWVESAGQKAIVIGRNGGMLKAVGTEARRDMETLFGRRVNLKTWVKVRKGWTTDSAALKQLGYES